MAVKILIVYEDDNDIFYMANGSTVQKHAILKLPIQDKCLISYTYTSSWKSVNNNTNFAVNDDEIINKI